MDQLPRQTFTQEYSLHQIDCKIKSWFLKILSSCRGQRAELPSHWGQAFKLRPILLSLSSAVQPPPPPGSRKPVGAAGASGSELQVKDGWILHPTSATPPNRVRGAYEGHGAYVP